MRYPIACAPCDGAVCAARRQVIDNVADDEEDAEYTEVVMRDLSVKLTDFTKPVDIDD